MHGKIPAMPLVGYAEARKIFQASKLGYLAMFSSLTIEAINKSHNDGEEGPQSTEKGLSLQIASEICLRCEP